MNKSDVPDLIVLQNTEYGISIIKIFSTNSDFTQEITSDENLTIGVARAGGFRGNIHQNKNHNALIYNTLSSGTGEGTIEEITSSIENNNLQLKKELIWEGRNDKSPEMNLFEIKYSDISDRKAIENLASIIIGEFRKTVYQSNDKNETEQENNSIESQIQEEIDAGKMVVSGLVKVFNHDEMVEYQDFDPEILPDMGESYVVLILEEPEEITMHSGGGPDYLTRTTNLIKLPDDMNNYEGQNITISFGSDDGFWQSDVSLPMDAPRMREVKVLK